MQSRPLRRGEPAFLSEIQRSVLPDGIRLTVDLDAEVAYHQEEIGNPRRLFFDLKGVKAAPSLQDVSLKFDDDVVQGSQARPASAEHHAPRRRSGRRVEPTRSTRSTARTAW